MARKLNVWGGGMTLSRFQKDSQFNASARVIMAGTKKDFGARTGIGADFCSITGNDIELKVALAKPGVIFWARDFPRKASDFQDSGL